ncbi:hypothetical protein GCM10007862_17670 [Dyella lipolytica]|uniref:Uncharacterized protein n=1 Tax=Dyella lipolytica TaxID=1867835 RepID=A0ABW8IUG8_9GAMM|nr:hypothetical protein [Dyella lipolytica]GLQ46716.1 hypothetical protein GCM10007862_17670 [Dyella lipolytica]
MNKQGHTANLRHALHTARGLRKDLGDTTAEVDLTIKGGGNNGVHGGGTTTIACTFDITSEDYDTCNNHLNDLAAQGCYCTGPTQGEDGKWYATCNCPD